MSDLCVNFNISWKCTLSFCEKTYTGLVKRHLKEKNELWEEKSGEQFKNFNLETNKTRSSRGK